MSDVHDAARRFVVAAAPLVADAAARDSLVDDAVHCGEATYLAVVLIDALACGGVSIPDEMLLGLDEALSAEPRHMYRPLRAAITRARALMNA